MAQRSALRQAQDAALGTVAALLLLQVPCRAGEATFQGVARSEHQANIPTGTGARPGDEGSSAVERLIFQLIAILSALLLGVLAVRLKIILPERGDMTAMGFYTGNIGLPLLVFRAVATADLNGLDLSVVAACGLGKMLVVTIVWLIVYFAYKPRCQTKKDRFLTATVFAMATVLTNDFALGKPVITALYGDTMTAYVAMNAVVGSALFAPLGSLFLAAGSCMSDDSGNQTVVARRRWDCILWPLRILKHALTSYIIVFAILGLVFKVVFSGALVDRGPRLSLPPVMARVVDLFTAPFSMCSLFMTGTHMRSVRVSFWPLFLVTAKVVVVAFLSFQLSTMMVQPGPGYVAKTNFSFFYGTVPPSTAPIVLGSTVAPNSVELVATAIFMALFLSGLLMYMFALTEQTSHGGSTNAEIARVQAYSTYVSVFFSVVFGAVLLLFRGGWGWGRPGKQVLGAFGLTMLAYQSAMVAFDMLVLYGDSSACNWSGLLVAIDFLQNNGRMLVIGLQVLSLTWGSKHSGAIDYGHLGLALIALSLAASGGLCRLVRPNATDGVCAAVAESRAPDRRTALLLELKVEVVVLDAVLFLVMLGLGAARLCQHLGWPRKGRCSGQWPSGADREEPVTEAEGAGASVECVDRSNAAVEADALEEWLETPPYSVASLLVLIQVLRLLTQVVTSSHLLRQSLIQGGLVTMMALEYFLEHGQGFLLLVGLLLDKAFMAALTENVQRVLPWLFRGAPFTSMATGGEDVPASHEGRLACLPTAEFSPELLQRAGTVMFQAEVARRRASQSHLGSFHSSVCNRSFPFPDSASHNSRRPSRQETRGDQVPVEVIPLPPAELGGPLEIYVC